MKLRFTSFALFLIALIIVSCNNDENLNHSIVPEETTTSQVSLCILPAIEQSDMPMARANTAHRGLYAINVLWQGKGLTSYQPYVSGLFDDISQIEISLIDGYKYRFDCSFLVEDELPCYIIEDELIKYGRPFSMSKNGDIYAPVTNKLIVSLAPFDNNTQFYQGIYWGSTETEKGKVLSYPSNHRYYGSNIIDLTQTKESYVTLNIELQRAYCNLMFESKDIPSGDKIEITLPGTDRPFSITGTGGEDIKHSEERLLALYKTADSWGGKINVSEQAAITVQYYSFKTQEWHSIYQDALNITLKRNKRNIVRFVNIDQANGEGNISIDEGEVAGAPTDPEYQEIY